MSFLPPEQTGYFEAVQVFFTEVTDRMVLFGARDRKLLTQWKEQGRPARLVCRGIKEAVASCDDGDPPRSLSDCQPYVDDQWESAREGEVGGHECDTAESSRIDDGDEEEPGKSVAPTLFEKVRRQLENARRGCEDDRWDEAYLRAWELMKRRIEHPENFHLPELEEIDRALVDAWLEALDDEERREIEDAALEESSGFVDQMSPSAKRQHLHEMKKRALVDRYGLLDLFEVV